MATTYILFSESLNKYYIGHTQMTVEQRLSKHLTDHSGFSAQAEEAKSSGHAFLMKNLRHTPWSGKLKTGNPVNSLKN
jgi:putative endonuclease